MSASILVQKYLRPAAVKAGVIEEGQKVRFGFHNFRHSLASALVKMKVDVPTASHRTLTGDLTYALERLRCSGIERVIAADLSRSDMPVSVMRIIVPGLEGPTESKWYRPGHRLKARLS